MLACAGLLSAAQVGLAAAGAPCRDENVHPRASDVHAIDTATLCLINRERAAVGLDALSFNPELRAVAASQVANMVRWDYFADVRPTGQTPMSLVDVTRYPAHTADIAIGQNIAWGTGEDATPARIVAAWMASPPHREIMLSGEYAEIGAAVMGAVPKMLGTDGHGATYAIELGVRRF